MWPSPVIAESTIAGQYGMRAILLASSRTAFIIGIPGAAGYNPGMKRDREWRKMTLARARLLVVLSESKAGRSVEECARAAIAGGATLLELRLKHQPKGAIYVVAERLVALCRD